MRAIGECALYFVRRDLEGVRNYVFSESIFCRSVASGVDTGG